MDLKKILRPNNYLNFFLSRYYRLGYDLAASQARRVEQFSITGFDYATSLTILNEVLRRIGKPAYDEGTESVHWPLCAALSSDTRIKRILEIGTFDGKFTSVLAALFPNADVITLDLPDNDPIVRQSYHRGTDEQLRQHLETRTRNLSAKNIHPLKCNSFFLLDAVSGPFDLIWVDGGHLYPEIAWDLSNAHHLVRNGGVIMCDDVIMSSKGLRDAYVSPDSYTVLEYAAERGGFEVSYFMKRLSAEWSARPTWRKFVAYYRKPN